MLERSSTMQIPKPSLGQYNPLKLTTYYFPHLQRPKKWNNEWIKKKLKVKSKSVKILREHFLGNITGVALTTHNHQSRSLQSRLFLFASSGLYSTNLIFRVFKGHGVWMLAHVQPRVACHQWWRVRARCPFHSDAKKNRGACVGRNRTD